MAGRDSLEVAAIVFAEFERGHSFTAKQFNGFLAMAGKVVEDETADEILADLAVAGSLRQVGPGVYSAASAIAETRARQ